MAIMDMSVAVMQVFFPHKLLCCYWQMIVKQELLTLPENVSSSQILVEFILLNLKFSVQCFVDHCLFISLWPLYYMSFFDASLYRQTFLNSPPPNGTKFELNVIN